MTGTCAHAVAHARAYVLAGRGSDTRGVCMWPVCVRGRALDIDVRRAPGRGECELVFQHTLISLAIAPRDVGSSLWLVY